MKNNIYVKIGKRIRAARTKKGATQRSLAIAIRKSTVAISNYEKGIRWITLVDLKKIAQQLGEPISYFIGEKTLADYINYANEIASIIETSRTCKTLDKFYKNVLDRIINLFNYPLASIFSLNETSGEVKPITISSSLELKKKIKPVSGLDILTKDLKINLRNEVVDKLKKGEFWRVKTKAAFEKTINLLFPHLTLLSVTLEKIFGDTNWIVLPIIYNEKLAGIICINFGDKIVSDEEIEILKLLKSFIGLAANPPFTFSQ